MADLKLQVLLSMLDKASAPLRGVRDASSQVGKALAKSRAALKALEADQRTMEGWKNLKRDLDANKVAMGDLTQRQRQLTAAVDRGDESSKAARTELKRVTRDLDKLGLRRREQLGKLRELRGTLATVTGGTRNFAAAETRVRESIVATTLQIDRQKAAYRQLAATQALQDKFRQQRSMLGGKLMGTAATAAVGGYALGRVLGAGNDFEYQLQLIGNTADMTSPQLVDLRTKILAASEATGQLPDKLQAGIGFLIAAGQSADVAARSIAAIGRTTTAAGADIEDVSKAAFTLTDTLKIQPEGLQKSLDILAQAGKEGNVELRDMAKQLPVLAAGFSAFKMSGNEAVATMGAALEIARKGAADPDEAANNMRNYMAKVLSPETLKKAQAFGIDMYKVITDAQQSGGNPLEASIEAVMKATGGDQKKLGEMFQDMQVQNFLKPIQQNWQEYQRIKATSLAATGVTDRDFAKVTATNHQQLENLRGAASRAGFAFSKALAPSIAAVVKIITPLLAATANFIGKHPKLTAGIVGITVAFVGLRLALLSLMLTRAVLGSGLLNLKLMAGLTRGAIGLARVLGGALLRGIVLVSRALLLNPIGIVITLLAGAAYLIWRNWDKIKPMLLRFWGWIADKASATWQFFKSTWATLAGFFAVLWEAIKAPFVAGFAWIGSKLDEAEARWKKIKDALSASAAGAALATVADSRQGAGARGKAGFALAGIGALALMNPTLAAPLFSGAQKPAVTQQAPIKASGNAATTNNYAVTVNASPGHENAAAQAVSAELDRRERAKAARGRSALSDRE